MISFQSLVSRLARYRYLYWVAIIVFGLDQLTKYWVSELSDLPRGLYPPYGGYELIPGFFSIVYTTNAGAAWGIFEGYGMWLAALGLIALAGIFFMRRQLQLQLRFMQLAFGLLIGGIAGNLVDRAIHGHVIDFLDFHLLVYRWPTFNIADCGIVIGVAAYSIYSFILEKRAKTSNTTQPSA